jgi:hypothetical protein
MVELSTTLIIIIAFLFIALIMYSNRTIVIEKATERMDNLDNNIIDTHDVKLDFVIRNNDRYNVGYDNDDKDIKDDNDDKNRDNSQTTRSLCRCGPYCKCGPMCHCSPNVNCGPRCRWFSNNDINSCKSCDVLEEDWKVEYEPGANNTTQDLLWNKMSPGMILQNNCMSCSNSKINAPGGLSPDKMDQFAGF